MKRIRKLILIGLIGGILIMSGCAGIGKTKEDVAKETLRNKYNEEFIVHEIDSFPDGFDATLSPVNNSDVLFMARMENDGSSESDNYGRRYLDSLIKEELEHDLSQFFPNAYYKIDTNINVDNLDIDFRQYDLQELLKYIEEKKNTSIENYEVNLSVFMNAEDGSLKKYEEEYTYFSEVIPEKIKNYKGLPIIVTIYCLTNNNLELIREYFSKDLDIDSYYEMEILQTDNYLIGIVSDEDMNPGNPPNMSACFIKKYDGYIKSEEEYIRRRKIIENGSIQ